MTLLTRCDILWHFGEIEIVLNWLSVEWLTNRPLIFQSEVFFRTFLAKNIKHSSSNDQSLHQIFSFGWDGKTRSNEILGLCSNWWNKIIVLLLTHVHCLGRVWTSFVLILESTQKYFLTFLACSIILLQNAKLTWGEKNII